MLACTILTDRTDSANIKLQLTNHLKGGAGEELLISFINRVAERMGEEDSGRGSSGRGGSGRGSSG